MNRLNIALNSQFQRSKRLDTDQLDFGYVLLGTGRQALQIMGSNIVYSNQRAFTWTGPYGCGKSSLALLLTSLVGTGSEHARALDLIGRDDEILAGFASNLGWRVFRLVGRQGNLMEDLASLLKCRRTEKSIVTSLARQSEALTGNDGVLLIIDELGKYLEADCASANTYLLQELAEFACRASGKIVLVGILHQAMDAYAARMPLAVRDEWTKVQGRFIDIPLAATTDETLELLSKAISHPEKLSINQTFVAEVELVSRWMAKNAAFDEDRIRRLLMGCWPLNPVVALMLGPVSRRKFSQNERSIYSFLSAIEPYGFADFLANPDAGDVYSLAQYWDYLQANFEAAILSSLDSHRWITAVDAVGRAESLNDPALLDLAKCVAVIDLFRVGSRLQASAEILAAAVGVNDVQVATMLQKLVSRRVLVERRHVQAWAIYAGSDFDIEAAIKEAATQIKSLDIESLSSLVNLDPIVARSHYFNSGTMRWFNRRLMTEQDLHRLMSEITAGDGAAGEMVMVLPDNSQQASASPIEYLRRLYDKYDLAKVSSAKDKTIVLGLPVNVERIIDLTNELQIVDVVASDPSLEGDETGRNEVNIRRNFVRQALMDELNNAFITSQWCSSGGVTVVRTRYALDHYVSDLCAASYSCAPVIKNELINRDHLSGNVKAARKELMLAMINNEHLPRLGFEQFPPAFALYSSMLKSLHCQYEDQFGFIANPRTDTNKIKPLWDATDKYLQLGGLFSLADLYKFWRKAPIGLRSGPMPILALAYLLGRKNAVAVYLQGELLSTLQERDVDQMLVAPTEVEIRYVGSTKNNQELFDALREVLVSYVPNVEATPLSLARAIVRIVLTAPAWARKTHDLSKTTLAFRSEAFKASDPFDLVLKKIPEIFKADNIQGIAQSLDATIKEYLQSTPKLYQQIKDHLFTSLQASQDDLESLKARAAIVKGLSGDMVLEAFVTRISLFTGSDRDILGLWNLATTKPMEQCSDLSLQACLSKISEFAYAFRQQEAFARVRGRDADRYMFSLVVASGEKDITTTVEITSKEFADARNKAKVLFKEFEGMTDAMRNAVLAQLGLLVNQKANEGN